MAKLWRQLKKKIVVCQSSEGERVGQSTENFNLSIFKIFLLKLNWWIHIFMQGFLGGSGRGKESACNVGEGPTFTSQSGRSPREMNGYQLLYSCLDNSIDRRIWWVSVHAVWKNQIWLTPQKVQINSYCKVWKVVLMHLCRLIAS